MGGFPHHLILVLGVNAPIRTLCCTNMQSVLIPVTGDGAYDTRRYRATLIVIVSRQRLLITSAQVTR
ncbi:hypothetical protein EV657_1319 [Rhodovulum visakhapatnamense]|uniref:Uncharacterized protein n=1 Tax=Rhodovulum visakhapatnamense TaxID=364297 RepID=A0A4R8FH74_9RHOB|nr:hypothetical protein EV657_1319 [Rhodovulum visakhapatnamense]